MRLHRFFVPKLDKNSEIIVVEDGELLHQWRNVFRMKAGQRLALFDGSGPETVAVIESLKKENAVLRVKDKANGIVPKREVWFFFPIIKKDNMELILEKATELGVSHFVPVLSERSEKKGLNGERARKIIIEAAEQCGRGDIPKLREITDLKKAVEKYGKEIPLAAFDPSGSSYDISYENEKLGFLSARKGDSPTANSLRLKKTISPFSRLVRKRFAPKRQLLSPSHWRYFLNLIYGVSCYKVWKVYFERNFA